MQFNVIKDYFKESKEALKTELTKFEKTPTLTVIQVGDNPSSNSYIKGKMRDCEELGIIFNHVKITENIDTAYLVSLIHSYSNSSTDGLIVQLPLPSHISKSYIIESLPILKDVDGFNSSIFYPCTPLGISDYLDYLNLDLTNKNVTIIGRSKIVGVPLATKMLAKNANVTVTHSKTTYLKLKEFVTNSDYVFTCIDKIEYFGLDLFENCRSDVKVIDIGLGKNEEGKLVGNLKPEVIDAFPYVISGVGGVGLLTRLSLLKNVIKAAKIRENLL